MNAAFPPDIDPSRLLNELAEPYGSPADLRGDWWFESAAHGVVLRRGSVTRASAVLPDEPGDASVGATRAWCEDSRVDLLTEGHRVVLVALASPLLLPRRRWRVAWLLADAFRHRVSLGIADEDPLALAIAPDMARVRWYLMRMALDTDGEISKVASPLLGDAQTIRELARRVRTEWTGFLLRYEDYPSIGGIQVDEEARRLMDSQVFPDRSRGEKTGPGGFERSEHAYRSLVARELLARRFLVSDLWREYGRLDGRSKWGIVSMFMLVPLLLALTTIGVALGWTPQWLLWSAVISGVLAYASLGFLVPFSSERLTYPFLLRFAATSLIGVVFVQSLPSIWLKRLLEGWGWLLAAVVLMGASYGYLVVEARLHGSHGWTAFRRAGAVAGIGLVHGLIAALAYVQVLAPLFGSGGVADADVGANLRAIAVVASGAVAAGVFLQVLWEDRPVTYPLGVLRYRGG